MTPQEKRELQDVLGFVRKLQRHDTIPKPVGDAFSYRLNIRKLKELPDALALAPLAGISDPSGGATIDAEARSAIALIISRLEDLGLITE